MSKPAPSPFLFPENLLVDLAVHDPIVRDSAGHDSAGQDSAGHDAVRKWWAVYTKPRQEKALARQLFAQGIPHYLPLVKRESFSNGRRFSSELPLFASYVFMFGDAQQRIQTLDTKRVVQMLASADQQAMTRDLRNIHALVAAGAPLTVEARLQPGQRVRVKSGALMGVEGLVVSRRGESRLVVAVQFLQQGVSVVISDFQVEPL
jgi:transcriptional antiterminator RfaH